MIGAAHCELVSQRAAHRNEDTDIRADVRLA